MDEKMSNLFLFLASVINFVYIAECMTIDLIHPYSSESPINKPNITRSEMIRTFSLQPYTRKILSQTNLNNSLRNIKVIRPELKYSPGGYFAKLKLGIFDNEQPTYKTYYLHLDTASDVTWLQCEECATPGGRCFHQKGMPYPSSKSRTFQPLHCNDHPLCFPDECFGPFCSYDSVYSDGSYSFGVLAYETFYFGSSPMNQEETAKIVIGCGIQNKMIHNDDSPNEAGILGLSWGPQSFVNQKATGSLGRFSYCLPPLLSNELERNPALLHFGLNTPSLDNLHGLKIHKYDEDVAYYVTLEGISINNQRLNIPQRYFSKTSQNHGGCILDTGTTYSIIPSNVFRILKEEMINYLARADKSLKITGPKFAFDLCYERSQPFKGYKHLPTVTFHFEGGVELVNKQDIAFVVWYESDKELMCLAIAQDLENNVVVVGAQTQANHVFVYDLSAKMVFFGPQDCSNHP